MLPFTLVLAGGGARGFAHVGVLRALEEWGLQPSGIVGVSMGAVVAATYALRDDWYDALLSVPVITTPVPIAARGRRGRRSPGARRMLKRARTAWNIVTGWGAPDEVAESARRTLDALLGSSALEDGRIPVTVCSTDLISGRRVEIDSGSAVEAAYASSALAGVFPPAPRPDQLLVDGVYSDIAPVDVARRMGAPVVIAVDPSQPPEAGTIENGLQAVMRAMEICERTHAHLRIEAADLAVRPVFPCFVDVLDFGARRICIASGLRAARGSRGALERLLHPGPSAC